MWTSAPSCRARCIAELLADGTHRRLAADRTPRACSTCAPATAAWRCWPRWPGRRSTVDAADISRATRWRWRASTSTSHGLADRIRLLQGDGLAACAGRLRPDPVQPAVRQRASRWRALPPDTRPSPRWRWPAATTAWTSSARCCATPPAHMTDARACWCWRSATSARISKPRFRALEVVWLHDQRGRRPGAAAHARSACAERCHDHAAQPHAAPRREGGAARAPRHAATPARKSAWSAATAPASPRCSRCSPTGCTPTAAISRCRRAGASAKSRSTMPETDDGATDFVLQGDTPLMDARRPRWPRPKPAATAMRSPTRTCARRGRRLRRARPRPGAAARPGLQDRAARRAGQQLLRRLAHAAAAGARADVPGRPAAARRADQPPRPRRAGLAGELAASATTAR